MVHSIVGEQIEKRFIAGHFSLGDITKIPNHLFIKGYFLHPSPEIPKEVAFAARLLLGNNLYEARNDAGICGNSNGLGTAVVAPASGYYALMLWKEKNQIGHHSFEWRFENDLFARITFAPCSRMLAILGEEVNSHYMPLLKSPCGKEDLQKYAESWLPNKELN
jgi:hypothetical protein